MGCIHSLEECQLLVDRGVILIYINIYINIYRGVRPGLGGEARRLWLYSSLGVLRYFNQ